MRSPGQHVASHESTTRASAASRARRSRICLVAALALTTGACSVSYPLYGPNEDIKTGSINGPASDITPQPPTDAVAATPLAPPPGATAAEVKLETHRSVAYAAPKPDAGDPPAITPSDWAYARGALSLAMGAEALNASVPWANPDTGAYGSFSASATVTLENGATCRPFSASHSGGGREQRLEGTACRTAAGYWEAVAIKAKTTRVL
ncbi:RT0821/Lpp0805 family surface protein [Methylopila sp. M107]|uniref:RT0821/Lpp0805 family surface protein n=1 Tax=Methylopila sp. M107 TaxID=1101190 RepID=UPI0003668794|nr:RT0821/Lpp0805 family surface protein [Methylopila sp. M107]